MSGGNWDYFHTRFSSELENFCTDIKERFPELAEKLQATGKALCEIIGEIDSDVCDDAYIKSDKEFVHEAIEKIKKAIE